MGSNKGGENIDMENLQRKREKMKGHLGGETEKREMENEKKMIRTI